MNFVRVALFGTAALLASVAPVAADHKDNDNYRYNGPNVSRRAPRSNNVAVAEPIAMAAAALGLAIALKFRRPK